MRRKEVPRAGLLTATLAGKIPNAEGARGRRLHFVLDSFVRGDLTRVGGTRRMPVQRPAQARRWAAGRDGSENHRPSWNRSPWTLPGGSECRV